MTPSTIRNERNYETPLHLWQPIPLSRILPTEGSKSYSRPQTLAAAN